LAKDDTNVSAYEALATLYITVEPNFDAALKAVQKGIEVSKARHDFLTFSILKKTAEVRKKVIASLEDPNHQVWDGRYDQLLVDACGSPFD